MVAATVAFALVGLTLVMLDPDRRWTPKVSFRPLIINGGLHLERCASGLGGGQWVCFLGVDWVSEREVDVDDDGRSDVRALMWDDGRPTRCVDLRPGRRFSALDTASCCCLQIGCAKADDTRCPRDNAP